MTKKNQKGAILSSRSNYKNATLCGRNKHLTVIQHSKNKSQTVIRHCKNKLQIVILCIEIFNTYIKFADKISVFSLFSPPLYSTLLEKGCGEKHFSPKRFFPTFIILKKNKKIISLQRRWRCGILRKECRQFPAATRWLL